MWPAKLSNARLMDIAEFIHDFTDEGHITHNSKCSFMWRRIDNAEKRPEGQGWIVYFMGISNDDERGEVTLQFAKLGSCYIYGSEVLTYDRVNYYQEDEFTSFLVRAN